MLHQSLIVSALLVLVSSIPAPYKRDMWSHLKHKAENIAHHVGHAAENAAATALATSMVEAMMGKREASTQKRDFWSHMKHNVEHFAHDVGHIAEASATVALTNSAMGMIMRGRRSVDRRDMWSEFKNQIENMANTVGNAAEKAWESTHNMVSETMGTKREEWSVGNPIPEAKVVAEGVGKAVEDALMFSCPDGDGAEMSGWEMEMCQLQMWMEDWWNSLWNMEQTTDTGTQTDTWTDTDKMTGMDTTNIFPEEKTFNDEKADVKFVNGVWKK